MYGFWQLFPEDIRQKVCEKKYEVWFDHDDTNKVSGARRTPMTDDSGSTAMCCPLGVALFEAGVRHDFLAAPCGDTFLLNRVKDEIVEAIPSLASLDYDDVFEINEFIGDFDNGRVVDLREALGV